MTLIWRTGKQQRFEVKRYNTYVVLQEVEEAGNEDGEVLNDSIECMTSEIQCINQKV